MALTGFETFSRVLLGWLGRALTKDSVAFKNQLVKARIPLLAEDYVASSFMQIIATFLGGLLFYQPELIHPAVPDFGDGYEKIDRASI